MILLINKGSKFKQNKGKKSITHLQEDCYKSIMKKRNNGNLSELL